MDIENFHDLTEIIVNVLTIFAGILGGFWVYAKYIIEKGFLPASQLDIECNRLGSIKDHMILDVGIHIKNVGSSTLIAKNIVIDLRYIRDADEQLEFTHKPLAPGRLMFPHSLKDDVATLSQQQSDPIKKPSPRGLTVVPWDTFVQPGVDQRYSFITKVPSDAKCALIYTAFEYAQRPWRFQNFIYKISRSFGLTSYSLQHIEESHNAERAFWFS